MDLTPLRFAHWVVGFVPFVISFCIFFGLMRGLWGLQEADREELHELVKVMRPSIVETAFMFLL